MSEPLSTSDFFLTLYGTDAPGFLNIFTLPGEKSHFSKASDSLVSSRRALALATRHDVYFGLGLLREELSNGRRGCTEDVIGIPGFWFDLDIKGPNHKQTALPETLEEALELIRSLPWAPTLIVFSGGGIHGFWLFKELWIFDSDEERKQAARLSKGFQGLVIGEASKRGWIIDNTSDLTRVLRVVGTYNRKQPKSPVLVKAIENHADRRYSPSDFEGYFPADVDTGTAHNEQFSDYPPADLGKIVAGCAWLRHCRDDAATLPEPEWYASFSILVHCKDGEKLAHEWSRNYPKYSLAETDKKLRHALEDGGPRTCASIEMNGGAPYCIECSNRSRITSPIVLGNVAATVTVEAALKDAAINSLTKTSSNDEIISCLRVLAGQTKRLDKLLLMGIREGAVKKLKEIGVQSRTAMVDVALSLVQQNEEDEQGIKFAEQEAYQGVVDGAVLLDTIKATLSTYIFLPRGAAETEALWILHAHALDAFDFSPFLAIVSPEKRCGKTANLELTGSMVPRPLFASNITAPALFRAVEKYAPTLLIDEADTFIGGSDELRGVLNSGHRRKSAFVIRCVGDNSEPKLFKTWSPKIVARIGELPDTLADRSITIRMVRKSPTDKTERLRLDRLEEKLQELCKQAAKWANDNIEALRASDPLMPEALNDRAADSWRPLIAIADCVGGTWPQDAREAAKTLSGIAAGEESSVRVRLLTDIKSIFESDHRDAISSVDLASALSKMEDRKWGEWKKGKPITPIQVAGLLKPFKIAPRQVWINQANYRGYALEDFADAFTRYIPSPEVLGRSDSQTPPFKVLDPLEPNNDAAFSPIAEPLGDESPNTPKNTVTDSKQMPLTPLTPQNPLSTADTPIEGSWKDQLRKNLADIKKRREAQQEGTL